MKTNIYGNPPNRPTKRQRRTRKYRMRMIRKRIMADIPALAEAFRQAAESAGAFRSVCEAAFAK